MKNILVFGGFGFLGYYLSKELNQRGYNVTVADIQKDKELENMVAFVECDITNRLNIQNVFKKNSFDYVYNLAGYANLETANKFPVKTIYSNVIGNMYILEECIKNNIERFIYASSAYATSHKGSFYGISKLSSEKIIEEYSNKYGICFTILRYGSVYSEKKYKNNYIYNLVKSAVLNNQIDHEGDGNEVREYIHAADASKLSVDIIESEKFNNMHVILTGTERMKRLELFNMINEILSEKVKINCSDKGYNSHYKYTPYSFYPSVSKKLIANPHIDLGQGLLECVRSVYDNEK